MQSNQSAEGFKSINDKLSQFSKTKTQPSTYRVHKELRDVNDKAYEPNIIAIGPYHHGKDELKMMEEQKVRYLQLLLDRKQQDVEIYISAINQLEQKARDFYAEPVSLIGAQFVEMLVLDGCFIIELARKHFEDPTYENDPVIKTKCILNSLVRDLILFENQIPFFVLCELFDRIEEEKKHHTLIAYLLHLYKDSDNLRVASAEMTFYWSWKEIEQIKSLLDLVYTNWVLSTDAIYHDANYDDIESGESSSLLDRELQCILPATKLKDANVKFLKTTLRDANVEFQRNGSNTVFDVKFEDGTMAMPPLLIQDGTESLLRNFIAFEQYFLSKQGNIVTDYVIFLDCLINSSRDVEILSECGVIDSKLGDNEAVANIINRLGKSVVRGQRFAYAKMFTKVKKYYRKPWNMLMAKSRAIVRGDIFSSPLAYLSYFAATAILVLTMVQTLCSILQVV